MNRPRVESPKSAIGGFLRTDSGQNVRPIISTTGKLSLVNVERNVVVKSMSSEDARLYKTNPRGSRLGEGSGVVTRRRWDGRGVI